ncbi:MAG: hypothetical protein IKC17_02820 [Bacteroidales bacterium]|nr:hypothetical protein [Bacteroidales bacterium]
MAVDFPLGVWLTGGRWFYLGCGGWNGGWWYWPFEGSRLCRFLLFYNPQTPFEGGFGRCAPMFGIMSLKKRCSPFAKIKLFYLKSMN